MYCSAILYNYITYLTVIVCYRSGAYPCIVWQREVRPRQQALLCDGCTRWQHRTCGTGISQQQYREAISNKTDINWTCSECNTHPADSPTATPQPHVPVQPPTTPQLHSICTPEWNHLHQRGSCTQVYTKRLCLTDCTYQAPAEK